jgi:predicted DCC family thiol-disulfide oxidoreductase YuxK
MRDKKKIFKFLPLQSDKAQNMLQQYHIDLKNIDTVVLIKDNNIFFRSDAALEIADSFDYPWKAFYFLTFIPKFVRDWIYDIIARHRYSWFGKRETCMIPNDDIVSRFLD